MGSEDVFVKLLGYARKQSSKPVFPLFEQAFENNAAFRDLVNSEPKTVDDFFAYFKNHPGSTIDEWYQLNNITLASLLKSRFAGISDELAEKLAKVPRINTILNDPQAVSRINVLDNIQVNVSKGSGYSASDVLTERDAFLFDLQHVVGNDEYGSLRKMVENSENDLPQQLIDNWKQMKGKPTLRRRASYLNATSPQELKELLDGVDYLALNLATIKSLAPGCTKCYEFYQVSSAIRKNIWEDAKNTYQELGKVPGDGDWGQFFASFEAHHILPKDLLVPSTLPGAENAFTKYLEHYKGAEAIVDFNGIENGIMLKKYSTTLNLADGVHASHNEYTRKIRAFLDGKYTQYKNGLTKRFSGSELEREIADLLHTDIVKLQQDLKTLLKDKSMVGGQKVNALADEDEFLNLLIIKKD